MRHVQNPREKCMICRMRYRICTAVTLVAIALAGAAARAHHSFQAEFDISKPMTLKGTVKAEGDKIVFVNDADQKSWDVMNPETLKGHEGHHVKLNAHFYPDKGEAHVMSLSMNTGDDKKTEK